MEELWQGLTKAIQLIFSFDREVMEIAGRSLWIAATSCSIAALICLPLGSLIAMSLGADRFQTAWLVIREARYAILTALIMGFGRAISELGLSIMVGGNIRGYTRTITTAISLETSKGDIELSIALGIILIFIALVINLALNRLQQR